MTIQEQINELKKVVGILVRSKSARLEKGKLTETELVYQIECCQAAVNSLERLLKLQAQLKQALETLKEFDFEMIQ